MKIAVLIPCFNEEKTIGKVVCDFKKTLPEAEIYVYDNNSTDSSRKKALENGAKVVGEIRQGKGFVVRQMLRDVKADYYLLVDGDGTYLASDAKKLLEPLFKNEADMTVGNRLVSKNDSGMKSMNLYGNKIIKGFLNLLFKTNLKDVLSGYRGFSYFFANNVPIRSKGFEIETELTLKALEGNLKLKEIPISYLERPKGSYSKLRRFPDGFRILKTIVVILRDYRPMVFFFMLSFFLLIPAFISGEIVLSKYLATGLVDRIPLWILSIFFFIASLLFFVTGFILKSTQERISDVEELLKRK